MTTNTPHINRRVALRIVGIGVALAAAAALTFSLLPTSTQSLEDEEHEGRAPTVAELTPSVVAGFPRESYTPGSTANLVVYNGSSGLKLQLFHSGPERAATRSNIELKGIPMAAARRIDLPRGTSTVAVRIGKTWPTGVYFARLEARNGLVGYAPFVLRPRKLGEHRIAVVMPTLTWQAYNLRDENGDGTGDSWYADWKDHFVKLGRPYLNRGVPSHYRSYDLPFLHWLAWTGRDADYLADADIAGLRDGDALAKAYDLIVFPGHHEYVTTHEYDVVQGYRDLGGNLAFLSANNFFWQVIKRGDVIERTKQWRDLDRPEASLIGVQYRGNDQGQSRGPWIVRNAHKVPWLLAGTKLRNGSTFGSGGIEIDKTSDDSPDDVTVVAEIPNLFGKGFTAQMTYYETKAGAKVFASGAFTIGGSVIRNRVVRTLVGNVWTNLGESEAL